MAEEKTDLVDIRLCFFARLVLQETCMAEEKTDLVPQPELLEHLRARLAEGWEVRSVQIQTVSDGGTPPQWRPLPEWNYWVRLMRLSPGELP